MQSVGSFLPQDLANELGGEAVLDLDVAVLSADIAGFSRRANALLDAHGSDGAARLADLVGQAFTVVVETVHGWGGEVVHFAGDALLAWWRQEHAAQAAACAQALSAARLPAGLELRVGFGQGTARAMRLGGHREQRLLALVGDPVQNAVGGAPWPAAGDVQPPAPTPAPDAVRVEYVPAFVRRRVLHGGFTPELRHLSALFIQLQGIEDAAIRTLQRVAEQHFGVLDKVLVDDKGALALVLFGLPATLAPYVPDRAMTCALALRAEGFGGGMGIGTGRSFVGLVGPARRQELMVLGPAVNRAARLMQQGRLLADVQSVHRKSRVKVADAGRLALKGFDEPVAAVEVVALHPAPATTASKVLAGRGDELTAIAQLLGSPGSATLVLEGEAGIGKSRLLQAAAESCDTPPLRVVGDAVQRGTPLYSLRGTVLEVVGGPGQLAERLADHPDLAQLHPLLGPALGVELEDTAATAPLKGFVRASRTQDLLVELLTRASPGGATLLVEDGHWVDQATLAVLARLRRQLSPLRILIATRPEVEATGSWQNLVDGARHISLKPLERGGIGLVLEERLGARLPDELVAWVGEHSDGNPFFALELLAGLVDDGRVQVTPQGVVAPPADQLSEYEPPATVEGAVTWRIDALEPDARDLLSTASVLGSSFRLDELLNVHTSEVDVPLRALLTSELLLHAPDGLRFSHVIVRDVAYGRMPQDQRRALHAQAAAWLDAQPERDRRGRMPLLAWHWSHCDEDRALEALEWCWLDARREGAMHEAYRFLARAVELDEGLRQRGQPGATALRRAGWQRRMAAAVAGMGQPRRIHDHARAALELLDSPAPAERWGGAAAGALLRRAVQSWMPASTWRVDEQGQSASAEAAMAWTRLAEALFYLKASPLAMLTSALNAVNAARASGRVVPVTTAWGQLGLVCGAIGWNRLSLGCLEEARTIADEVGEPTEQSNAWLSHTMIHSLACRWDECEPVLGTILPLLRASRNPHLVAPHLSLLAANDYLQGRFDRARDRALELLEFATEVRNEMQQGWGNYHLAQIGLALGQHDDALRYAQAGAVHLRNAEDLAEAVALGCIAQVHARRGDAAQAHAPLERLEGLLETAPVNSYTRLEGYAAPAEAWLVLGELDRAEASLKHLKAFSKRFVCGRPRLHLLRGELAAKRGKNPARHLKKAAELAHTYGLQLDEARAQAALGNAARARESFTRLRARWFAEQLP